jgi:hypothetical protein
MELTAISTVGTPRTGGPKTAAGKRRSSRNSIKHGIFSKSIFTEDENRADFRNLYRGLMQSIQPDGIAEKILVEKLAALLLRQRRL